MLSARSGAVGILLTVGVLSCVPATPVTFRVYSGVVDKADPFEGVNPEDLNPLRVDCEISRDSKLVTRGEGALINGEDYYLSGADRIGIKCESRLAPGRYSVVMRASCQPEVATDIVIGEHTSNRATASLKLPAPQRSFLMSAFRLKPFPGGAEIEFPPNTEVEVVRHWPGPGGNCSNAIVRVIAAGGIEPSRPFYVARLDTLAKSPVEGPSADEYVRKKAGEDAARKQVDLQREIDLSNQESKTGKCSQGRLDGLQQALSSFKTIFESDQLLLEAHVVDVASATGTRINVETLLGGEYHVIVAGHSNISMHVTNTKGQILSTTSPYVRVAVANRWHSDARLIQANRGEKHTVSVTGAGCFLMMSLRRY